MVVIALPTFGKTNPHMAKRSRKQPEAEEVIDVATLAVDAPVTEAAVVDEFTAEPAVVKPVMAGKAKGKKPAPLTGTYKMVNRSTKQIIAMAAKPEIAQALAAKYSHIEIIPNGTQS